MGLQIEYGVIAPLVGGLQGGKELSAIGDFEPRTRRQFEYRRKACQAIMDAQFIESVSRIDLCV